MNKRKFFTGTGAFALVGLMVVQTVCASSPASINTGIYGTMTGSLSVTVVQGISRKYYNFNTRVEKKAPVVVAEILITEKGTGTHLYTEPAFAYDSKYAGYYYEEHNAASAKLNRVAYGNHEVRYDSGAWAVYTSIEG